MARHRHWIPPGQPVRVAGHDIPGGLIYVGQHLRSTVDTVEPALIDPELPAAGHRADLHGHNLGRSPSYHTMTPADRAAYLVWLAHGRRRTDVPIGFVSLFFSGLERRVLVDAAHDPTVRRELPAIAAEVRRMQTIYASANSSFHSHASGFLDILELLTAPLGRAGGSAPSYAPPAPRRDRWPVPMALRVGLARFAVTGTPVPADWARSWAWYHPSLFPRTPQTRCAQEFDRLFTVRYTQRFGAGLILRATGSPIRIGYHPASPGIDSVVLDRADLPDLLEEPAATRELGALVDSVTDALTPYSRWLARTPDGRGSLAATALLPPELLDRDAPPLCYLLAWASARLDGQPSAVIDAEEFGAFWSTADPARMSKDEAASLALVLARAGLGVEPDVRFGGPALAPGPAALFRLDREMVRLDRDAKDTASPGYLAATTMLHLAAAVISAAGQAGEPAAGPGRPNGRAIDVIVGELATTMRLTVGERSRLGARLRWLLASGATFTRLSRRISALNAAERAAAGDFLIAVATAAPVVSPDAVTALTRAYRLIGLDPDLVYRRLHRRSIAGGEGGGDSQRRPPPAEAPVVVRSARPGAPGHALPRTPPAAAPPVAPLDEAASEVRQEAAARVRLSREVVTRRMAETEAVSLLLATIFTDDEPAAGTPATPDDGAAGLGGPAGLDRTHSALLRELAARPSWARTDFAELAARHGVLPAGALDLLNEAAMEAAGEPVVEGDDDLTVNDDALRELLS